MMWLWPDDDKNIVRGRQDLFGIAYPPAAVAGRPGRRPTELRRIRQRQVLSQAELAERSGVSRATIVSLESGRAGAQYGTIRKIAQALGVEPADLMEPES